MTYNSSARAETNEVVGQRYLIVRHLREEPWGEVWLAQDNCLKTEVGLKLLPRDDPEWPRARDMYENEAILGIKLRHPHILGVFHIDKAERFLYLVQEPFTGASLMAQLSRQKHWSLPEALDLLEHLGQALTFVHQQHEVHQFFSPQNILLLEDDLRIANPAFAPAFDDQPLHMELKAYVPPEVLNGDRLTTAGNMFSLGVLGFRLVAGSLPYPLTFDEPFPYRLEYPPADLEEIPVPLQNVLLRCLSEDPEERLPHAGAFVSQLRQARELIHGVSKEPYASSRPNRLQIKWKPLAQAAPFLQKVWQENKPRVQQVREEALIQWTNLKQAPRRLWWGMGMAVLFIALIIGAVKLGNRPASQAQSARLAAPVDLKPVGGGPPMIETAEETASREAASPVKKAAVRAPAAGSAASGEVPRTKEDRYHLLIATYNNLKQAEALQQRLRAKKINAVIMKRKAGDKTLYLVQVRTITGTKTAEDTANRIKSQEKITPKIVKLSTPTGNADQAKKSPR